MCTLLLSVSLIFPWLSFKSETDGKITEYWAFSLYTGGIGYGMLLAVAVILFFLLSHSKKESLRAYVPFRLSDAQAIVFIDMMILTACIHSIITSLAYTSLSAHVVEARFGMKLGLFTGFLLLFSTYFFSQREKSQAVKMSYLGKTEDMKLTEYQDIISGNALSPKKDDKKNMTLPI